MQVKRDKKSLFAFIAIAVLVVALLGVAGYFAKSYYDLRANPNQANEQETKRLTAAVGQLYQLPKDEEPIVGKIQDKEKLKDQPFFKASQNGDDILIYQKAKLAIIYRAKENKLINVGPIAIDAAPKEGETGEASGTEPASGEEAPAEESADGGIPGLNN